MKVSQKHIKTVLIAIIISAILIIIIVLGKTIIKPKANIQISNETSSEQYNQVAVEKIKKWQIEIPAISLIANISEGTEEETLKKYVGHFEDTSKTEGNIGLAAHNRGYPVNYFEKLKELKGGEEIIYTNDEFCKTYIVIKNIKIADTDWSYLQATEKNQITLITCIENEPSYRRCVQAIEKEDI